MRNFYQVTDADDANVWAIPGRLRVETLTTPYQAAISPVIGADGGFDPHGDRQAPLGVGRARISFQIQAANAAALQTAIDSMMAAVHGGGPTVGLRKLWREENSDNSAQRWTYARGLYQPRMTRTGRNVLAIDPVVEFALPDPKFYDPIDSTWLGANGYTSTTLTAAVVPEPIDPDLDFATFSISSTPTAFTLTNAGTIYSQRVIFYLVSLGAAGFTNPVITNTTTGQSFSTTRDGADASTRLSINAAPGLGRAQLSADGGSTWADDTAALTVGSLQAVLMELAPGDNVFSYVDGGTPNLTLYCWWAHAYRE